MDIGEIVNAIVQCMGFILMSILLIVWLIKSEKK